MTPLIATPCHDWRCHTGYVNGLISLLKGMPGASYMFSAGESDIRRSRNDSVAKFLYDTYCDRIAFVDSDVVWTGSHAARIFSHDLPITAALYPLKRDEGGWVWRVKGFGQEHPDKPDLCKVGYVGTGGILTIKREVFEAMKPLVDSCTRNGRQWWDFFSSGIYNTEEGLEYLTEDYGFCYLARKAGFDIWVDRAVRLGHIGQKEFEG